MPNQAKWSLPIWVQKPFAALWRAPVSSTVIQAARLQPGAQHVAASSRKRSWPSISSRTTWRLEIADADRPQLRHQPRHGDLALMVLGQHEAAQLRPEVADDAGRQRRHDGRAVRRQPALAAIADRRRPEHQVLDHEVLVALEARAGRHRGLDAPGPRPPPAAALLAAPAALAAAGSARFGSLAFSMPLGLLGLTAGPTALQPGDLLALRRHRLLQRRHLAQQFQHQFFEFAVRQIIESVRRRLRHRAIESENRQFGNPSRPHRVNRSHHLRHLALTLPGVMPLLLLILNGVTNNEPNLVQGVTLTVALAFVVINAIVDLLYVLVNPRIRTI